MTGGCGPLEGVRVVEIGEGRAVPLAARILGDLGAEVIKIEHGTGDPTRRQGPFFQTEDGESRSALFEYLNWNKSSLLLDPYGDTAALRERIEECDVLLVGDDLDVLRIWGIRPETLLKRLGDLVIATVTAFGTTGPKAHWKATDLSLQAASGVMSISGSSDREPLRRGLFQSTYEAALSTVYAVLAALLVVRQGDGGTFVDVSMAECLSSELVLTVPEYGFVGAVSTRRPPVLDPLSTGDPLPAGEGYVSLQLNSQIPVSAFVDLIGDERLADPRFATAEGRSTHAADLDAIFRSALVDEDPRELFVRISSRGLLAGFVQEAGQLLSCPHLEARRVYRTMPGTLGGGPWRMPVLSVTRADALRPAPALGEHADAAVGAGRTEVPA